RIARSRVGARRVGRFAARDQHAIDAAVLTLREGGVAVIALLVSALDAVAAYGAATDHATGALAARAGVVLGAHAVVIARIVVVRRNAAGIRIAGVRRADIGVFARRIVGRVLAN